MYMYITFTYTQHVHVTNMYMYTLYIYTTCTCYMYNYMLQLFDLYIIIGVYPFKPLPLLLVRKTADDFLPMVFPKDENKRIRLGIPED